MDDLDVLARDFGRGKSNPMRSDTLDRHSSSVRSTYSSSPFFDDHSNNDGVFFNNVFGAPLNHNNPSASSNHKSASVDEFDYDSLFKSSAAPKDSKSSEENTVRASSLPVYDKPVYDDDMFDELPEQRSKSPSSGRFDDYVFVSMASPSEQRNTTTTGQFDDLLGELAKNESSKVNSESEKFDDLLGNLETTDRGVDDRSSNRSSSVRVVDDLLGGFGSRSSDGYNRSAPDPNHGQKPLGTSQSPSRMMDDPFVVLETTSPPVSSSKAVFTNPLEEIGKLGKSRNGETDTSFVNEVFDDLDPLNGFGSSAVPSPDLSNRGNDTSSSRSRPGISEPQPPAYSEHVGKSSFNYTNNHSQTKMQDDNIQQSPVFDIHDKSFHASSSSPSHVNANDYETNTMGSMSSQSEEHLHPFNDIWLSVSEIPLFTQPTRAPPPSRPPPPIPMRNTKSESSVFPSDFRKRGDNFASLPAYEPYSQTLKRPAANSTSFSQIDELEDFAAGTTKYTVEEAKTPSGEEMNASSVAADAMKEAMDRAEAKFKHAKEVREREYVKAAKTKQAVHVDPDDEASVDAQEREIYENQERLERERWQREEEEREQRRHERERERAREIERERGRQAVERATREARERAAAEARLKAERVAVGKVQNEARERAERAAVFRAQAEARERAAAEARERQQRAAAEREKAAAEARDKEAREKAAAEKATAEARRRAERAAVERAAGEARERAAAEARERAAAAAAARANQQKNENDMESFFNVNSRPSSAPGSRGNSSDPFFDPPPSRGPGGSQGPKTTHAGSPSNMPKAFSSTNIVDDLSSFFGVDTPFEPIQEVVGETEERRKARLDRSQRTQERAAKALAEKNQRDLQAQREQEERNRIGGSLDIEIKRWSAGKEGNLRALLSTLQYVLWPECGWQPVSLTDLIVGSNVKKVYRKATLCIHPDKVQQKGATLQQKYIAEKVFDLLKEAWNKFNSEELF